MVLKDRTLSTFGGFWLFARRLSHINPAMIQLVTEFPKAQWQSIRVRNFIICGSSARGRLRFLFFSTLVTKSATAFFTKFTLFFSRIADALLPHVPSNEHTIWKAFLAQKTQYLTHKQQKRLKYKTLYSHYLS